MRPSVTKLRLAGRPSELSSSNRRQFLTGTCQIDVKSDRCSGAETLNQQIRIETESLARFQEIRHQLDVHSSTLEIIFDALQLMSDQLEDAEREVALPDAR